MNPSKMRNVYGKLMYIIMDTQSYHVKNELKLNFVKPIRTVYTFLEEKNSLFILEDSLWIEATKSHHSALQMTKKELALDQQRKAKASEALLTKYTSGNFRNYLLVSMLIYPHLSLIYILFTLFISRLYYFTSDNLSLHKF